MAKELKDWIVPWLFTSREYNVSVLDKAWANPDIGRLMLNENPIPPSDKVINSVSDALKHGNWYPDSFLRLRTKIGKSHLRRKKSKRVRRMFDEMHEVTDTASQKKVRKLAPYLKKK